MGKQILKLENITKEFPGVKALDGVTFELNEGEVHVLLGENGAGKSTLMKVLAGVHQQNEGRIIYKGEEVKFSNPKQAQDKHIAIIYQEFNLMPNLTVGQNIYLGREPRNKYGLIDKKQMYAKAQEMLDFLQVDIDVQEQVSRLGVAQQQLVEVAKALSIDAEILIMDEPTASLSDPEIEQLFNTIKRLQEQKVSIIYISHRLQELKVVGNRITVIRDGRSIGTRDADKCTMDELITMMVGREIGNARIRLKNTAQTEDAVRVEHVTNRKLEDISIHVKKGEIVGIAGLVGSGRTELANAVYGIDPIKHGKVTLFDRQLRKPSPGLNIRNHMGFIPESRKEDGLALSMSIQKNTTCASLKKLFPSGWIKEKKETEVAAGFCKDMKLNTENMEMLVQNLSGGNQQKVVLAKWMCTDSDFLIFDEPTRGIDVGAKEEIHNLMNDLASKGAGIIMISSDLPEILTLSDRIYVMREGRIVKELPGEGTTQEEIIGYAAGKEEKHA